MDNPMGNMPQLPPNLTDKLDQLNKLVDDIRRDLEGIAQDPIDDYWTPPWEKPGNLDNTQAIIDALRDKDDPFGWRRRSGLKIGGVEMTQSIQFYDLYDQGSKADSDNMVPLVAGKDLILRAYVERSTAAFVARPYQLDGTVRYRGKELKSLNGPQPVQEKTALRRRLRNDSLNFRIPAADCRGTVTFTIRVFDPDNPSPLFGSYASYSITATFHEIPRMRITGVLVHFTGNSLDLPAPTGIDLVNSLARFLPMLPTQGYDYNVCSVIDYSEDLTIQKSWDNLLNMLSNMRAASSIRTFYVGLLPANTPGMISSTIRGIGNFALAVGSNNDTRALSHELGHASGLMHIDAGGAPSPFDTKYPNYSGFSFGSIGEVGVDSARMELYDPTSDYDLMTYWENGSPIPLFTSSTWISPYHYKRMMNFLRMTDGTADIVLSVIISATAMLLNFRVYRSGRVEILPSYPVTGLPSVRDTRPELGLMLDLYDADGEVIGSYRCHQHNPYQDPDGAYLDFHEVLPWSERIGEIAFVREREELSRLRVGEGAPDLRLEGVRRLEREEQGDLARVEWAASGRGTQDSRIEQPAALVRYSNDGGQTWQAVAADLQETRCLVNLDLLPGGEDCRFQVVASSGLAAAVVESERFAVRRKPRRAYIVSPRSGETFHVGEPVVFAGAGHSPDFGVSASDEVTWSSSLEGVIGAGVHLVRTDLHPGTHRISLSTPDGQEGEAAASIWIKIVEAAPSAEC